MDGKSSKQGVCTTQTRVTTALQDSEVLYSMVKRERESMDMAGEEMRKMSVVVGTC